MNRASFQSLVNTLPVGLTMSYDQSIEQAHLYVNCKPVASTAYPLRMERFIRKHTK